MNIRDKRKQKGYTQSSFAKEVGVAQCTVSQWERGCIVPSIDKLILMSKIFNCTIDDLLREDKNENLQIHSSEI